MRFDRAVLALLWSQANGLVALSGKNAQNLVPAIACQRIRKKSTIADDDAKRAHACRRGRNITTYAVPSTTISPPHHTGACKLASCVGGGFLHSVMPL